MKNLQAPNLKQIVALATVFINISGSISLYPVLIGPHMAYLGSRVAYRCIAPNSSPPVTYDLMRDGDVPIARGTDFQGNQNVSFFLKVAASSEGTYHCRAEAEEGTGVSNIIKLSVVTPASNTRVTSEPSPPVAYEGSRIVLKCDITKGSHLSYTWFFNRKEVTPSTSPIFHLTGNKLVMEKVTPKHAGHYSCMAWSTVQDIRRFLGSKEVQVTVKAYVSRPRISFSISKEGDSYRGNVTCWSTRGSHPANFSLTVDDEEEGSVTAAGSLAAWFPVAIVPGLDMGVARCRVKTEMQELMSDPLTLEVVPVGGDVKVEVDYLYGADSTLAAARLSCQVSRGTFPYISWLFNDSILPSEGPADILPHIAWSDRRQTLVLTQLRSEESGYYRCRVRDGYDDSGPWVESVAVLVRVPDRNFNSVPWTTPPTETPPKFIMTTTEIITMVFCCFLFLMLAVGVACVYRMFDHNQAEAHTATTNQGTSMPITSSADSDDPCQTLEITV